MNRIQHRRPSRGPRRVKKARRTHRLHIPVTPTERTRILWAADSCQLPVASYLRRLGLGRQPRAVVDRERIDTLLRVVGDVGRFRGLLKLWLSDIAKLDHFDRREVEALLCCVQSTKQSIVALAERSMAEPGSRSTPIGEPFTLEQAPPPRKRHLFVPVTPEEAAVRERADSKQLSVAAYLRSRGTCYRPLSSVSATQVHDLTASSEALAQQGWVIKRWLSDDPQLTGLPQQQVQLAVEGAARTAGLRLLDLQRIAGSEGE